MKINKNVVIIILLIIVSIFVYAHIFRGSEPQTDEHQPKIDSLEQAILLKDSLLDQYQTEFDSIYNAVQQIQDENDSLTEVKQKVKTEYETIYVNLNGASNKRLDSLIKTYW